MKSTPVLGVAAVPPQQLKPLTTLRFFAAMWVVGYHYWPSLAAERPPLAAKGYLGVELFFVLSGFILSHVYLQAFGQRRFRYLDFLWARLARVYPLHLATLLGLAALIGAAAELGVPIGGKMIIWSSLPAQLTLTQAWGLGPLGGWNHPAWSISAEWFAYLTFPAFAWIAWAVRGRPRLALTAALVFMAALESLFGRVAGFPLTQATQSWGALRIVPCFALGCAIYLLWRHEPITNRGPALGLAFVSVALIGVAAMAGLADSVPIALFGALIFALASPALADAPVLAGPAWIYLGEVSYAIYMASIPWQMVFERALRRWARLDGQVLPWPVWLVELLGVIPAAMALHHLVERPARRLMRRRGLLFLGRGIGVFVPPAPAQAD